jgi:FlaA1/EpsC-like NDP-sugar epimerase
MSANKMKQMLQNIRHPRVAVVLHDLMMVIIAWLASSWLVERISGTPFIHDSSLTTELVVVTVLQTVVLWTTGLYRGLWRFASFQDMWNIVRAAAFGTVLIISSLALVRGSVLREWLQSLLIYPVLLFVLLGLPRMCYRFWKDSHLPKPRPGIDGLKRVLILGAGHSGALLERELRHRGGFEILGFLDDNARLRGAQVHGVPVLGTLDRLPQIGKELEAELVIIAMPSANNQQMQRIVEICEQSEITFRTLPTMQDLGNRATRIGVLKKVAIDDLLGREPVSLNWESIRDGLAGKRVMITGGGGSIGSELCRQIARLNPIELIVVDNSEYSLYRIDHELRSDFQDLIFYSVLGDICDPATVEKVVGEYKPDMIFHAAAYKHLPILQTQIREAFRNNVLGTM